MNERVKVFTYLTGHGATIIEPQLEDTVNGWLAATPGKLLRVTQSESERPGTGHHVTLCVWYLPEPTESPF